MSDNIYWHVVPTHGLWAELFFTNTSVARGELFSVSYLNEVYGGTAQAGSGYGSKSRNDPKELEFERIRQNNFSGKPSRIDALYLFDKFDLAEQGAIRWFGNEERIVLETRLVLGSKMHRGDTRWLDLSEIRNPDECALAYWQGEMTEEPLPEVVVHGHIYFPRWEEFPTAEEVQAGKLRDVVRSIGKGTGGEVAT